MAKRDWKESKEEMVEVIQEAKEMSLEEAQAFRASLAKPEERILSDLEKREEFRKFWALNKSKYGKGKEIEEVLWVHLASMKMDLPEVFEQGLEHFGLKKTK